MRTVKRILRIHHIDGHIVHCLFSNGESRVLDFQQIFEDWNVKNGDIEYPLLSLDEFQKMELIDGTLSWKNIEIVGKNEDGNDVIYPYEIDPIVLYEKSEPDPTQQLGIGTLIKETRNELQLTQEELAQRSGTSKHHISRIENNRTGTEISTLIKIIEGGLGKKMKITIQ